VAEFDRVFRGGGLPDEIPVVTIAAAKLRNGTILLANALVECGLAPTTSDARRAIEGGGAKLGGATITDPRHQLARGEHLVQIGKRKVARIVVP
jgi:tyrosyl-tRNA synthetase